jgi:predicted phosphodiesterase
MKKEKLQKVIIEQAQVLETIEQILQNGDSINPDSFVIRTSVRLAIGMDVLNEESLNQIEKTTMEEKHIVIKGQMDNEQMIDIIDLIVNYSEKNDLTLHIKSELFQEVMYKQQIIDFANWLDKLTPVQRISVWSKNGEGKGLFNMDNEQLFEKFKKEI